MFKLSKLFVSLFGLGFIPFAPGTMGSLIAVIFFYLLLNYISAIIMTYIFLALFFLAIGLINIYSNSIKKHDASEIVMDEFIGIVFILIFYEFYKFTSDLLMFSIIFIMFRFFDILKIFPANWIDKNIKNSWGIIIDDLIAAVYCIVILYSVNTLT